MLEHMGIVPRSTFLTELEARQKTFPKEELAYDPRYDSVMLPDVPDPRRSRRRKKKKQNQTSMGAITAEILGPKKFSGISAATATIRAIRKWKAVRENITKKLKQVTKGVGVGAFMTKFFAADANNDGSVDRNEFMMMCKKTIPGLSKAEMEHLAASADDDGTGHIGMQEFTDFLKRDLKIGTTGMHVVLNTRKQPRTLKITSRLLRSNPIRLAQKKMKELDPKGFSYQMCTTEAVRTAIRRRNIHDAGTQRRDFKTWIHSNSSSINSNGH